MDGGAVNLIERIQFREAFRGVQLPFYGSQLHHLP